jgi:protein involved in polysaccharide export with SLBB domain
MKLTRLFLTFFLIVTGAIYSFSQGALISSDLRNVDIDKLSDADIRAYYAKAVESGLSEGQLLELVKTRNLSDLQATKLKDRISMLSLGLPATTTKTAGTAITTGTAMNAGTGDIDRSARVFDEKLGKVNMQAQPFNRRIFGAELFSETSTTFEPNLRIATPSNYVLGPDDELVINVFGYSEKTYKQTVNAEGNIYIENVGPILVSGLTMAEAETKIKARFSSTIYKAMGSGATKLQLRLGSIRSMRITIIGQAKKPGTYTVSSLTTLFNALYLCGGPSDQGSYRNIELIRGNKVIKKVDIYHFLTAGDRSDNILLQEQDVIRIPFYESRMIFDGQVKRAGIYEIIPGENFEKMFSYAGKFSDSAYRKAVTIYQITDEKLSLKTLPAEDFATYIPNRSDSVVVNFAIMRYANRVRIRGAVLRPGDYELLPGMELKQLIEKAGGLREDAYLDGANVLRIGKDLGPENVSFVPSKVISGERSIQLEKEDDVIINSIFDIKDKYIVSIEGEVNKSGTYEWRKDFRVRDLILMAGGISEAAGSNAELHIEISRRIRNADVANTEFKQSEIIRIIANPALNDEKTQVTLEPFDVVVVRPQPGYKQQESIFINGPVMYPGRYFLEKSGERISNIFQRAGGFTASADSSSVFIRRFDAGKTNLEERAALIAKFSKIPSDSIVSSPILMKELQKNYTSLSVDLQKAFDLPGGNDDIILESGDLIFVSQSSSLVRISGEVYFPTMIPYEENTNVKYYIKRTGDYTSMAKKNQTFVIYPDGKAEGVKKFLFFKSYPKVTPRSEIFVPTKSGKEKQGLSTGEWVALSSILATLTTLIVTVINAN